MLHKVKLAVTFKPITAPKKFNTPSDPRSSASIRGSLDFYKCIQLIIEVQGSPHFSALI
jgi:hypothetical protein